MVHLLLKEINKTPPILDFLFPPFFLSIKKGISISSTTIADCGVGVVSLLKVYLIGIFCDSVRLWKIAIKRNWLTSTTLTFYAFFKNFQQDFHLDQISKLFSTPISKIFFTRNKFKTKTTLPRQRNYPNRLFITLSSSYLNYKNMQQQFEKSTDTIDIQQRFSPLPSESILRPRHQIYT